jgi:DNA-binding response OmpR family regulator
MIADAIHPHSTVLLVDRDRESGAFLREALEREGYAVELAHDGEDGFERVLAGGIDLVVLHPRASDASSIEWCRQLAALHRRGYLPVILLAERVRGVHPAVGPAAGVAAHLTRPVDVPELLGQVRVWTDARKRLRTFYARLLRAVEVSTEANCA